MYSLLNTSYKDNDMNNDFLRLSEEEVFIDTCFMLSQDYDFMENFYKPARKWNQDNPGSQVHLYVTGSAHFELEKKTRYTEQGVSDRAGALLKVIDDDRFDKDGVFRLYNLHGEGNFGEGTFFDKEILCIAIKSKCPVSVLTRDKKLSCDLLFFNEMKSISQKQISVLTVNPVTGSLDSYADGKEDRSKYDKKSNVEFELY